MILILSVSGDLSTDWVIDWLIYNNYPFIRINGSDIYNNRLKIDLIKGTIIFSEQELPIQDINVVWYRKFRLNKINNFKNKDIDLKIPFYLDKESNTIIDTILYLLKDKKWLTNPDKITPNKCEILLEAKNVGFKIPQTYIISSKKETVKLLASRKNYIYKPIYNSTSIKFDRETYTMYTKVLSLEDVMKEEIPSSFLPSLIQEKIDKTFEIRSFFINGQIYSMAIFSQLDTQTEADFRNYNWNNPNRYVPYKMPKELEERICCLMKALNLNCGSLDFIKSKDGSYYFLEINPVGQFGMIDIPCNYHLHKKVAEELIKMDK